MRWTPELIRFLLCAALLCPLLASGRASAEPLRAVVRMAEAADQALYERVRGQASDLDVVLLPTTTESIEGTRACQLARARDLGTQAGARTVVWFVRAATQLEVLVADLAAERLLARAIERGEGELDASAQGEAAALVVRSALRASLLGTPLGTPELELAEPPPPPPPPVAAAPPPPPPPAPAPAVRPRRFRLGLGVQGALDGASDPGRLATMLRLSWSRRALELGVRGGYGFGAQLEGEVADVALAKHGASGYAAYVPRVHERIQLVLEGGVGVRVFSTDVQRRELGLDAQRSRAVLAAGSVDLGLRVGLHARVSIAISAGIDVLSSRVTPGYDLLSAEASPRFIEVARLWLVQPHAALELALSL